VTFTVYPEAEHDSWTETYNNPELYTWMLEQRRTDPPPRGR
jgi:predicted peptidase